MGFLELIQEQKEERAGLDNRMQTDSDLLYLAKYAIKDKAGRAVPDVINVTLNKPAVFAGNVISALTGTSQQVVVETEDKGLDVAEIEEFQKAVLNTANLRLQEKGEMLLRPFAVVQLCLRGRTARRVLFQQDQETGDIQPDIAAWDGRYVFYEMGDKGVEWAAYETTRSKRAILSRYGINVKGKTGLVQDCWTDMVNEVWIDGKLALAQTHSYGYCPVIVQVVDLGYGGALLDKNSLEHQGESIFFLIRDIIPELNRLVTILQTLNQISIKPPMKHRSKEGKSAEPPDYDEATAPGAMTSVDETGDIAPIDYGEAKQSAQMLYGILEKQFQEGSITSIDLGNLQFPLSAVALIEIGEGRDRVFLPRLQSLGLLEQQTVEMATKQCMEMGGSVALGTPVHKRVFSTKKLEGQYETKFTYVAKSAKLDIARLSQATAAERYYDPETILERILLEEDPKEVLRKRRLYMAETDFPIIRMHREIMAALELAEDGDEDAAREAKLMALQMGKTIEQIQGGQLPMPTEPGKPAEPLLPLLGEGGRTGGIAERAKGQ